MHPRCLLRVPRKQIRSQSKTTMSNPKRRMILYLTSLTQMATEMVQVLRTLTLHSLDTVMVSPITSIWDEARSPRRVRRQCSTPRLTPPSRLTF